MSKRTVHRVLKLTIAIVAIVITLTGAPVSHATSVDTPIVISQIYGGAGAESSTYNHNYVELFNRDEVAINLNGWTVQIAAESATGGTPQWESVALSGSVEPGHYYLVQLDSDPTGADMPDPDVTGTATIAAANGRVALVSNTTPLTELCPVGGALVDFVGYGDTTCLQSTPSLQLSETEAALRRARGCAESDDNSLDFVLGEPTPRNSDSEPTVCTRPVVLVEFEAHSERGHVEIRWETTMEEDTVGFNLYRGTSTTGPTDPINESLILAHGGTGQINHYSYRDRNVQTGESYYYYVEDVDSQGNRYLNGPLIVLYQNPSAVTLDTLTAAEAPVTTNAAIAVGIALAAAAGLFIARRR